MNAKQFIVNKVFQEDLILYNSAKVTYTEHKVTPCPVLTWKVY